MGDVKLITGNDEKIGGKKLPDKYVLKTQKKWERFNDPGSWRREYDLYMSDLGGSFDKNLRWPECYHAEMSEDETEWKMWFEYIDGVSGNDLTIEMRELAAFELGRWQSKLYMQKPEFLQNITCLTGTDWSKNWFVDYMPEKKEYKYIRSEDCGIPKHLRQMIIDFDDEANKLFSNVNNMPVVLCHRDFWHSNIIYSNGKIRLLDWDCTGWGYMFDDIVQLIVDETDVAYLGEYYCRFIPAYLKGFSEYIDISQFNGIYSYAYKMLLQFAHNPVRWYMEAKSAEEKNKHINTLQKLYDMKDIKF